MDDLRSVIGTLELVCSNAERLIIHNLYSSPTSWGDMAQEVRAVVWQSECP